MALRINNVSEPHEYAEKFPAFLADPSLRRSNLFAYIDAHDLGQMVQCCLETDGPGYETKHATSLGTPHASLLARRTARPRARGLGGRRRPPRVWSAIRW